MGVAIRRAGAGDRDVVAKLLDEAFQQDPVSSWVFPDPEDRGRTHIRLMGGFLDAALAEGYVDMTEDGAAAALWLSVPAHEDAAGAESAADADADATDDGQAADGPAEFRELVDPGNERVERIARLLEAAHPKGRAHEYLMLIAVSEDVQGQGVGTLLIDAVLDRCDREGLAAYLEASSMRSRALYERLGFAFTGTTVDLPDGPQMWPMWREPRAAARS
ncbi:Ribosomal protein S18 acetylase RimI [Actinacidiphila rubida]|uniref:Ribosomal protein S18 acetylase RimI n=2 Tax=Actinacidiphila rubida TaxID=310780 RepID=A0A1H8TCR4_9ACTN|nr:GNAT family N-acetyltransferase [Actinacidiphila rubida]SEO88536.1 Ribosomal protein S18 acetylase RimI [Actinacidiphila rubida]